MKSEPIESCITVLSGKEAQSPALKSGDALALLIRCRPAPLCEIQICSDLILPDFGYLIGLHGHLLCTHLNMLHCTARNSFTLYFFVHHK
jgi:hypothetical protein